MPARAVEDFTETSKPLERLRQFSNYTEQSLYRTKSLHHGLLLNILHYYFYYDNYGNYNSIFRTCQIIEIGTLTLIFIFVAGRVQNKQHKDVAVPAAQNTREES